MGVLFILVFEVSSHFEVEGAVCVHNPNSCILSWLKQSWEEEEAAGWQDMWAHVLHFNGHSQLLKPD